MSFSKKWGALKEKVYFKYLLSKYTLVFAKKDPRATIPTRRDEDGWYDIYGIIDEDVTIYPNEIVEIKTGLATAFKKKYRLDFANERGSTGAIGLTPKSGKVDSGYRGEIFLKMQNTSDKKIVLSKTTDRIVSTRSVLYYPIDKALCQAGLEVVPKNKTVTIDYQVLKRIPSKRGLGAKGSSGK